MSILEAFLIMLAGVGAGTINTIVGSGTLITFPTLLFFGYPPLVANMSNNVGLLPGGLSGVYGYRRELAGYGAVVRRLVPLSVAGGLTGALLLLVLPSSVFDAVVPALIGLGVLLVIFGPRLQAAARARHAEQESSLRRALLLLAVLGSGVYGGYFGAAQGVIMMGFLTMLMPISLQSLTAIKNVLVPIVNLVAAVVFISLRWSQIDWAAAGLIGGGSLMGGFIGAGVGRRLPSPVLRGVIITVGLIAIAKLTVFG